MTQDDESEMSCVHPATGALRPLLGQHLLNCRLFFRASNHVISAKARAGLARQVAKITFHASQFGIQAAHT
jgi:hypothetical protein